MVARRPRRVSERRDQTPREAASRLGSDLFLRMPWAARQTLVAAAGARNCVLRYGRRYRRHLARLAASESWAPERHAELQSELLGRLLAECSRDSPYYREVLAHLGPPELDAIARNRHMTALPLLDKPTLRAQTRRFMSQRRRPVAWSSTSGSTGSPLTVAYDRESIQISFAFLHRHRAWTGAGPWARSVRLSGRQLLPSGRLRPPFWLANPAERMLLVSTYHLRRDFAGAISRRVRAFGPQLVEGYPSALERLAELCPELAEMDSLVAVITTAETLGADQRRAIEGGFGVPVFDYYSASEGAPLIQECAAGSLHLRPESGIFEVLDGNGEPLPPGQSGELVVTSFRQWMTPLLRYRTGDSIALAPHSGRCACGSTLPQAMSLLGRQEDLVLTPDGRPIGMFAYRTLKHVTGLEEAQIRQRGARRFVVVAVPAAGARRGDLERQIRSVFARALGFEPEVRLELVAELPRGPGGKLRPVVREWQPGGPSS